jgi:aminoglycoside phosphotransferase
VNFARVLFSLKGLRRKNPESCPFLSRTIKAAATKSLKLRNDVNFSPDSQMKKEKTKKETVDGRSAGSK